MEDTSTPVAIQVVLKLPFRFGATSDERKDSWAFARVSAFSSRVALDKSFDVVTLGTPIRGVLEVTKSDYSSAQLIGCRFWGTISLSPFPPLSSFALSFFFPR